MSYVDIVEAQKQRNIKDAAIVSQAEADDQSGSRQPKFLGRDLVVKN